MDELLAVVGFSTKKQQPDAQDDEGEAVKGVAWEYLVRTIRNVEGLKRYQGLNAALRMLTKQVDVDHAHASATNFFLVFLHGT